MEKNASNQPPQTNKPTRPQAGKPVPKGGNTFVNVILWILGMLALIFVLKVVSYIFRPDIPGFPR